MNNTKLTFAIDASDISIKPLLQKEFLELSMKAISTAKPNRNNSWFTKEALEKGISTFKNKPILGYFDNGDFESHNGQWRQDSETDTEYWDTLGSKGERILGLIRSEDDVKIVEDKDGLFWICLTCALWTQYSFKQVKRLLKDAKRAKLDGSSTKSISVEVDITDYEELPDGILKINDFNLIGITILGSRNGQKIEPGIKDAELSVVDITGNQFFEKQQKALRLAYEKLDGPEVKLDTKEAISMEIDQPVNGQESTIVGATPTIVEAPTAIASGLKEFSCPTHNEDGDDDEDDVDENGEEIEDEAKNQCDAKQCDTVQCGNEQCGAKQCENTGCVAESDGIASNDPCHMDSDSEGESEDEPKEGSEVPLPPVEIIRDMAWLITNFSHIPQDIDQTIEYYKNTDSLDDQHRQYVLAVLERIKKSCLDNITDLSDVIKNIAGSIDAETMEYEQKMQKMSVKDLYVSYLKNTEALRSYERRDYLEEAKDIIGQVSLTADQAKDFYAQCESGKISSLDDLKSKVAVASVFSNGSKPNRDNLSIPVVSPNVNSAFVPTTGTGKKSTDKWGVLSDYINKD